MGGNEEPPLGSHLVTPRLGFTHHGIYAGDGKVIHYGAFADSLRRGPVEEVSVQRFAHGRKVWIRLCESARFDSDEVARRARSRMGENRYRLLSNNCEHFCEWCVHGEPRSYQVDYVLESPRRMFHAAAAFLTLLLTGPSLHVCSDSRRYGHGSRGDRLGLLRGRRISERREGVMIRAKGLRRAVLAAITAPLVLTGVVAQADRRADEHDAQVTDTRIQIDNDLFAGRDYDRDYTGGVGITISGAAARDSFLSLDPLLAALDQRIEPSSSHSSLHFARQGGLILFTPTDLSISEAQPNERPYASLLFTANGRMRVDADDRGAWSSSLTIGVLGLALSEHLHTAVHKVTGADTPRGYDHQISAGGEPTARYTLARHKLWIANPSGTLDVKTTVQGSVGYLTETSAAISLRVGRFDTPWWSFAPELTDYMTAPVPVERRRTQRELYFFAGARVKARAYNAFLQGQFRHSDVRYSGDEIEPLLAEAWIGAVTQFAGQTQLSYTMSYQTAELRDGDAARGQFRGGIQISHAF